MLTIFTIPKPFVGPIDIIQRNALRSWRATQPDSEILVFGDEMGVHEAARQRDAVHCREVNRNTYGTPLVGDVFRMARTIAHGDVLCFLNADILLVEEIRPIVDNIPFEAYLVAGRRWDVDIASPLDTGEPGWEVRLLADVARRGQRHPPLGSDCFIFPRAADFGVWPDFAVGRPAWDNWLLRRTLDLGMPVIDADDALTLVHQNHDYSHIPEGRGADYEGPEADANRSLAGGYRRIATLEHATHRFLRDPRGIVMLAEAGASFISRESGKPNSPLAAMDLSVPIPLAS